MQHSQAFSTSQRLAPPEPVTALFHAAGTPGVLPFRAFPLLESVAPLDARSPLDVTRQVPLDVLRQAAFCLVFPAQPPSGGCPSSKSVPTMTGVNLNHRSRCSPGLPSLQGSPRPRDGNALTPPPPTYFQLRFRHPKVPSPSPRTSESCSTRPVACLSWRTIQDCRPSWGLFPCHS
jgi:hypothetical protein